MLSAIKASTFDSDHYISSGKTESDGTAPRFGQENFPAETGFSEIIGASAALRRLLRAIETVAPTDASVLIVGETGTGKELVAKAIHRLSRRSRQTVVKLNCAAIPAPLLEAELFGHERGAFTGATNQRTGRFELSDKGTLFLDEIGDMPLELQPKILRVLQEREFERLGSSRTQKVDVRMVAATNQDLLDKVNEGEFRSDLYYRLNVFPIRIPPLRERKDDIPQLANHFAQKFAFKMGKEVLPIPVETLKVLEDYDYPGNVRELENIIERAVILSADGVLRVELLDLNTAPQKLNTGNSRTLEDFERRFILQTLTETGWLVGGANGAAMKLGLKRTTLISKMEKLGISRGL
ncbi:MAG TPA: sigma 54-interacting transcriptional regulator [Pyrinomonadaceae bacterium]|nr:sigma 54-interacting transcriptional regulator [Pyrinomonadaceae bacterium]